MLTVWCISSDSALRDALKAAMIEASGGPGLVQWTEPPIGGADAAAAGPALPQGDLLRVDARPTDRPVFRGYRQAGQLVLIVGSSLAEAPTPAGRPPRREERRLASSADDFLVWPCEPAMLLAKCRQWRRRCRGKRRTEQLEERLGQSARDANAMRRRLAQLSRPSHTRRGRPGDLRQLLARMEGISRLSRKINSLHLDQIVDLAIDELPALVGARLASLYFYDETKSLLTLQRHNHPYPINATINLADRPSCPMALALTHKELLLVNESDWAAQAGVNRPYAHRYQTGHCVIAPLLSGSRIVGVLNLADTLDGRPFDELTDLVFVRQLCEMLGSSIRNIELYQTVQRQARTDGMTGLLNHSAFMQELAREINRCQRYGEPLSLIIADVDSLKRINDELGHLAGDQALLMVARQIGHSIREADTAARYGGDEFAILLPSTALDAARAVAERIVQTIGQIPLLYNNAPTNVTVSLGIAQYDGQSTAEALIEQVDSAMYQAKRQGKNRVAVG